MKRVLFIMSGCLLILSLIANILSYVLPVFYPSFQIFFIIHFLIFIPFGVMVFEKRKTFQANNTNMYNPLNMIKALIPKASNIVLAVITITFVFTIINFYFGITILANGSPEIKNNIFVQNDHGKIIQISEQLFYKLKYAEIRLFSGHWVFFSIIPMFAFFYDIREVEKTDVLPRT